MQWILTVLFGSSITKAKYPKRPGMIYRMMDSDRVQRENLTQRDPSSPQNASNARGGPQSVQRSLNDMELQKSALLQKEQQLAGKHVVMMKELFDLKAQYDHLKCTDPSLKSQKAINLKRKLTTEMKKKQAIENQLQMYRTVIQQVDRAEHTIDQTQMQAEMHKLQKSINVALREGTKAIDIDEFMYDISDGNQSIQEAQRMSDVLSSHMTETVYGGNEKYSDEELNQFMSVLDEELSLHDLPDDDHPSRSSMATTVTPSLVVPRSENSYPTSPIPTTTAFMDRGKTPSFPSLHHHHQNPHQTTSPLHVPPQSSTSSYPLSSIRDSRMPPSKENTEYHQTTNGNNSSSIRGVQAQVQPLAASYWS